MQPPGRNLRAREAPITTCQAMAAALLPVVASRLADTPYLVRLHARSLLPAAWAGMHIR